jgi:hypothetical protein
MPDHWTNEIVLRANRRLVALRLSLGIAGIAVVPYLGYLKYREFVTHHQEISLLVITLLVIFSTYFFFAPLLRMLLSGNAIILSDQGLLDRTGGVDFVAWGEISGAHIQTYGGLEAVALDLRDPEAVLGRMSAIQRVVLRYYMKKGGQPVLYGSFAQGGAQNLLQLIQKRINSRPGNTGD